VNTRALDFGSGKSAPGTLGNGSGFQNGRGGQTAIDRHMPEFPFGSLTGELSVAGVLAQLRAALFHLYTQVSAKILPLQTGRPTEHHHTLVFGVVG